MRIDENGTIVLSRRNLLALLHKLDKPGSARTITKLTPTGFITVTAEDNDVHYAGDKPGVMTADTEAYIAAHSPVKDLNLNSFKE